jgi:hypothetical protein
MDKEHKCLMVLLVSPKLLGDFFRESCLFSALEYQLAVEDISDET